MEFTRTVVSTHGRSCQQPLSEPTPPEPSQPRARLGDHL